MGDSEEHGMSFKRALTTLFQRGDFQAQMPDRMRFELQLTRDGRPYALAASDYAVRSTSSLTSPMTAADFFVERHDLPLVEGGIEELRDEDKRRAREAKRSGAFYFFFPVEEEQILAGKDAVFDTMEQDFLDLYRDSPQVDAFIGRHNNRARRLEPIQERVDSLALRSWQQGWPEQKLQDLALDQLEQLGAAAISHYAGIEERRKDPEALRALQEQVSYLTEGIALFEKTLPQCVRDTFEEMTAPDEAEHGDLAWLPCFPDGRVQDTMGAFMAWARAYCAMEDPGEVERLRLQLDQVRSEGIRSLYPTEGASIYTSLALIASGVDGAVRRAKSVPELKKDLSYYAGMAGLLSGFVPQPIVASLVELVTPQAAYDSKMDEVFVVKSNLPELVNAHHAWADAFLHAKSDEDWAAVRAAGKGYQQASLASSYVLAETLIPQPVQQP